MAHIKDGILYVKRRIGKIDKSIFLIKADNKDRGVIGIGNNGKITTDKKDIGKYVRIKMEEIDINKELDTRNTIKKREKQIIKKYKKAGWKPLTTEN